MGSAQTGIHQQAVRIDPHPSKAASPKQSYPPPPPPAFSLSQSPLPHNTTLSRNQQFCPAIHYCHPAAQSPFWQKIPYLAAPRSVVTVWWRDSARLVKCCITWWFITRNSSMVSRRYRWLIRVYPHRQHATSPKWRHSKTTLIRKSFRVHPIRNVSAGRRTFRFFDLGLINYCEWVINSQTRLVLIIGVDDYLSVFIIVDYVISPSYNFKLFTIMKVYR